jgi:hypothetical protein
MVHVTNRTLPLICSGVHAYASSGRWLFVMSAYSQGWDFGQKHQLMTPGMVHTTNRNLPHPLGEWSDEMVEHTRGLGFRV